MTEIAELEQRTNALVARYDSRAKKDRERRERLAELLGKIEEYLTGSQREMERLSAERARADEENRQLRAMLQTLLAATEDTSAPGTAPAMRDLEARVERLVDTASSITAMLREGGETATERQPATSLPEDVSEAAATEGDDEETPQVENGEDREPLELTRMVAAKDAAEDASPESESDSDPGEDQTTVTRLIKRLGELKGAPGEEQADPLPEADATAVKVT